MKNEIVLDSSHVPGRIRSVPIVEWPGLWHWAMEGWERDINGQPTMWHSPKGGDVRCTAYVEFARGQVSEVLWTPDSYDRQVSALERIRSVEGLPWNLTSANCEQVIRWAVEGNARSTQLGVGLFAAFCVGLALLFGFGRKA